MSLELGWQTDIPLHTSSNRVVVVAPSAVLGEDLRMCPGSVGNKVIK